MRKNRREAIQREFDKLAAKLDAREKFYAELQAFFDRNGFIPAEYTADWNTYQNDKRPWKEHPGVMRRLWKAAKRAVGNG